MGFGCEAGASRCGVLRQRCASLEAQQTSTVALLILSYSAVSLCMASLSVCTPMIMQDLNFTATDIGVILAVGAFSRVLPKLTAGMMVDYVGAKPMLVVSLVLTAALQTASAFGSQRWYLTAVWAATRIAMCWCWPSAIRVVSHWFTAARIGIAMAVLSQAFYLGDAVSRLYLSSLIALGLSWREVFVAAAATTFAIAMLNLLLLRTEPPDGLLHEPDGAPSRETSSSAQSSSSSSSSSAVPLTSTTPPLAAADDEDDCEDRLLLQQQRPSSQQGTLESETEHLSSEAEQPSLSSVLQQLGCSPFFWSAVVWCSFNNLIDQVFLDWTPNMLQISLGISGALAGYTSMAFAIGGAVSALLLGLLNDRFSMQVAMKAVLVFLALGVAILATIAWTILSVPASSSGLSIVLRSSVFSLVFAAGVTMYGPYSLTTATIPFRYAGKKTAATVGSLLDGIATLVSTASGVGFGPLAQSLGWAHAFFVLAGIALATWFGAFWHHRAAQSDSAKLK